MAGAVKRKTTDKHNSQIKLKPMKAKAILLQPDMAVYLDMLSDEEAGILFKAIFRYAAEGEIIETEDRAVKMAFFVAREQIDRSSEKYERACIKKKEAMQKRWLKNKSIQDNTNECKSIDMDSNLYKSTDMDSNLYKSIQNNTNQYNSIHNNSNLYNSIDNNSNLYNSIDNNSNRNRNSNSNSNSNPNSNSNSNRNSSICNTNTIVNSIPNVGGEDLKNNIIIAQREKDSAAAAAAETAAEKAVKRIEKEKNDFWKECEPFIQLYGEAMVRDFYGYWTEDFQHGTGFRKQKEKTWNTARRLGTWARKQMEINNRYGNRNTNGGYDLSTPEGRAKDAADRIARNLQEEGDDDNWMP